MKQALSSFFQQAQYLTSAAKLGQCPPDTGFEVAFAGRSNSGKSSAINALTQQTRLARTSKTPGRTQLINFFALSDTQRLVDLPGYGYAKVPEAMKQAWQKNMGEYLEERACLQGVVLVMDIRTPLKPFDAMMLDWSVARQLPVHILLSKTDKLNRGPAQAALLGVKKSLKNWPVASSVQLFSALKKDGVDALQAHLANWLAWPPATPDA